MATIALCFLLMNIKEKQKMKGTKKTIKTMKAEKIMRTIDQLSIARSIAEKTGFKISDVLAVIEEEQKMTMEYVKMG